MTPRGRPGIANQHSVDVIIVGAGNAAFSAALAAQQQGARVLMLEVAPREEFGGNSRYTAGAMRFSYEHHEQLLPLLADTSDQRLANTDFGSYPQQQFLDDLRSFNGAQALTPQQVFLVENSLATMRWLAELGVGFTPIYSRQSFEKDGRLQFWGGLTLSAEGEGEGLVQTQRALFEAAGGEIHYATQARELHTRDGRACGVHAQRVAAGGNYTYDYRAAAVILACGGFEANEDLRVKHLGAAWRHAKVRGSRYNQGDGLRMASQIGAALTGNFGGCHATPMDLHTPNYGNPEMPHLQRKNYRKISYPFGVMLNAEGKRFVDEGKDFRNYTYAQYGRAILEQPKHLAWQIFDSQVTHLLYEEYRVDFASKVEADSLENLVHKLDGVDSTAAYATLTQYNAAVATTAITNATFDPTIKDGRATSGLTPNKTNWANRLEHPPFVAYPVTCGITFSYGGLAVNLRGEVCDAIGAAIPGLYACGELVANLFFEGYPGGSGVTSGSVFGRAAGQSAAQ